MALLVTKDNKPFFVSAEQAAALWLVHTGEKKGNVAVRKKVNRIAKWYLNPSTAPKSWQMQHQLHDRDYTKQPGLPGILAG